MYLCASFFFLCVCNCLFSILISQFLMLFKSLHAIEKIYCTAFNNVIDDNVEKYQKVKIWEG